LSLDPLSDFLQMALLAPSSTIPFVPQCTAYNLCDSLDWEDVLSDNEDSDTLAHAKIAHLTQLLAQRDVELSQKDAELAQKETEISFYDAELARKDIELERKNTDLDRKDAELAQRDAELERKNTELAQKNAELAQRDTELAQKNAELAQRDTELAQLLSQRDEESARNAVIINDVAQELLSAKQELAQREMEVKRKEEEEAAALKMEQERELAIKEKKELDAVFSLFRDIPSIHSKESNVDYAFKNLDEKECKFLRSLEESGEIILLVHTNPRTLRCPLEDYEHKIQIKETLEFVFTNCHYYKFTYTSFIKKKPICEHPNHISHYAHFPNHGGIGHPNECKSIKTGIFYASKLYSFINPLNIVYAKLVLSFIKGNFNNFIDDRRNFELTIRLIPGSYKNGSWRQLDGFFGMYINEITMEVSELPPPHE